MQKKNETIHLLLLDPSQNDAEKLVSLLRNAGKATRAHRITSEEDLLETLQNGHWDLCLARDAEQDPSAEQTLGHIRRSGKDIPFILLTDQFDREKLVNLLKAGGQDLVPLTAMDGGNAGEMPGAFPADFTDQLMLVVQRELSNLTERRSRRALSSQLHEAEKRCQLLLESSKDAIAYIDDGMHIYANQSYLDFLGYADVDEMICIPVMDTLSDACHEAYKSFMKQLSEQKKDGAEIKLIAKRADESEINIIVQVSSATYDGEPCAQIVVRPEQDNAELEERLKQISSQDLLTGLSNRNHMMEQIGRAISAAQSAGQISALAYIGLDNFVQLKSQVGIAGADLILGDIAHILRNKADEGMVLARLSDDAFALLAQPSDENSMLHLCEQIRKSIEDHLFDIRGKTAQLTCSIGIAPITEKAPKAQDLLGRAHTVSTEVRKLAGHEQGNGVALYNPLSHEKFDDENVGAAVQRALDNEGFRLLFQPIINLRGSNEEHYEVFLRMLDKDGKEVSPYDFLPPAGPTDLACKVDRWVLLQTIKQLVAHRAKGHDTKIFINLTAETLQDKTFVSWLGVALKAARLPGDSLIFQIAESDANTYLKQAKDFAKSLRELHSKIALSRFGGAINPFNTLKHVDIDYVKLDGSFTEEIQKNETSRETVKEMIASLQSAGKMTIMPMVENAAVVATLWQAGINYIQGFYLQAPTSEMNYDFSEH